jgi:hypothetical protein
LAVLIAWPDYEASSYGFARRASAPLIGLSCPVFLNREDTGTLSLNISNTTDQPLSPSIRREFSAPGDPEPFVESIRLAPGESKKLDWAIGNENIDLHYFIFANVLVYGTYPIPDRQAMCGIFIIDLPLSGTAFLILMITLSIVSIGGGLYILSKSKRNSDRSVAVVRSLTFLAGEVVLALIVGLMGWWIQAILILVIAILTIFVVLNFLSDKWK